MGTIRVATAAELLTALGSAQNGDVIALEPGHYGDVSIQNYAAPGAVTITSANPARPAVLGGLFLNGCSGLDFSHLELENRGLDNFYPFQVLASHDISFTAIFAHGALWASPAVDRSSFMIRDSANVSITQSDFSHLENGVCHLDSQGLTISDNTFEYIQNDGVHGGGSSQVTISGNTFTNFWPTLGEHPDAIQFFTRGTSAAAQDLQILGNTIEQGDGEPFQGVFLQDETGTMPFAGVTISGNTVVGGLYNAIAVFDASAVRIVGNEVTAGPQMTNWIRVESSDGVWLGRNTAPYLILSNDSDVGRSHNHFGQVQRNADSAAGFVAAMAALGPRAGALVASEAGGGSPLRPVLAVSSVHRIAID